MSKRESEDIDVREESAHTFHIPVMGTGFTIDSPLYVAKYGISSVISLVDDILIEQVRKYHCEDRGEPYQEIKSSDDDSRARRITAYLDLLDVLLAKDVAKLQSSPFTEESDITRYFKLLPDCRLKQAYEKMLVTEDESKKVLMQDELRSCAVPGTIDVNIMTKLDRAKYVEGEAQDKTFSDALSALRGYANSTVSSSIVFSAGMNQRLYSYAAAFSDFLPDDNGRRKKKIVLKVSDYRSALIQGKFLAKLGLWVSEYRIESGLNCGGHAFATKGYLIGPILEEFKEKKQDLLSQLHGTLNRNLEKRGEPQTDEVPDARITMQGGIGTASENNMLLNYYEIDATGWGTPFLLVPEATTMDVDLLNRLVEATTEDVYLSESSPMGIPFWNLRTSPSEENRRQKIEDNDAGSPCYKKFIALNSEFGDVPICAASKAYIRKKLEWLKSLDLGSEVVQRMKDSILNKSCICHDLGGGAKLKYGIDAHAKPAVCCGPDIAYFARIASLEEMIGHIYGKLSSLADAERAHMFIEELRLYVERLRAEVEDLSMGLVDITEKYIVEFKENLLNGIDYYRDMARQLVDYQESRFLADLDALREELKAIAPFASAEASGIAPA